MIVSERSRQDLSEINLLWLKNLVLDRWKWISLAHCERIVKFRHNLLVIYVFKFAINFSHVKINFYVCNYFCNFEKYILHTYIYAYILLKNSSKFIIISIIFSTADYSFGLQTKNLLKNKKPLKNWRTAAVDETSVCRIHHNCDIQLEVEGNK